MPSLTAYTSIVGQLVTDIEGAWDDVQVIYKGRPLIAPTVNNFAVIHLQDVANEWTTVNAFEQAYVFQIFGQWQWPSSAATNILDTKAQRAADLAQALEDTTPYASIGNRPHVSRISLEPDEDEGEQTYRVMVEFTVYAVAAWGA